MDMGNIITLFLCLNFEVNLGFVLSYYFIPIGYYAEMEELKVVPKGLNFAFSFRDENVFDTYE